MDKEAAGHQALLLSPAALQALLSFVHDRSERISRERRT
jgi:hypothetical protein